MPRARSALVVPLTLAAGVLALLVPVGPAAAARQADVATSLRYTASSISGRITSPAQRCVRRRDVVLLLQDARSGQVLESGALRSGDDGRWGADLRRRRLATAVVRALVVGSPRCDVAQSPPREVDVRRPATPAPRTEAEVSASLRVSPLGLSGTVTSSRAACERGTTVVLLGRNETTGWSYGVSARTDRRGRWSITPDLPARRGGGASEIAAVAVADPGCDVAQSPTRPFPA